MDFQTESAIFQIFGQPLGASAAAEQQQANLRKADRVHEEFFSQAEIEHLIGHKPKPAAPIAVRALTRVIGIGVESEPDTFAKGSKMERPLLVADKFGTAARRLIAKEIAKVRRTATGSILSVEDGLRSAWDQFSEFANPWQKTQAAEAIRQADSPVLTALLREAMIASEAAL